MHNFIYSYQHLPWHINPVAFSLGFLRIDWYSVAYLLGFGVVFLLLEYRIKKSENNFDFNTSKLLDLLLYSFAGLIFGARLGYVLFYNFSYYLQNPLAIISPYDPITHQFIGIYGMSYHGGLLGVVLFAWIFSKKNKLDVLKVADFVVPAIPAGYFFGRVGNFLNGELYGRVTQKFWGMYFPTDTTGLLRHPSQIYEAMLEGIILFVFLWIFRNREIFQNKLLGLYLIGYAFFRILVEFFRQPDPQIGYLWGFLTLGQILSSAMICAGVILIFCGKKNKKVLK
jgi:phosphatidylglycerol:prolipoprotein diacylglycerol transferase